MQASLWLSITASLSSRHVVNWRINWSILDAVGGGGCHLCKHEVPPMGSVGILPRGKRSWRLEGVVRGIGGWWWWGVWPNGRRTDRWGCRCESDLAALKLEPPTIVVLPQPPLIYWQKWGNLLGCHPAAETSLLAILCIFFSSSSVHC